VNPRRHGSKASQPPPCTPKEVSSLYALRFDKHQAYLDDNKNEHYVQAGGNGPISTAHYHASGNAKLIRLLDEELVCRDFACIVEHTVRNQRSDPRQALRKTPEAILER